MAATGVGNGKKQASSKLLTRESSGAAPSFRVYYGAGSVPFLWELHPGTPRRNDATDTTSASSTVPPPLTPPPSYYSAKVLDTRKAAAGGGSGRRHKVAGVLGSILPKIAMTTRRARSASTSFSFPSSTSSSFRSTACSSSTTRGSSRMHASSFSDEEDLTTAVRCFRVRHESFRALKGCRVAVTVRSALASVGGGGHGGPASTAAAQRV